MTDSSSGPWTEILVGHQSPRGLGIISGAATNRQVIAAANHQYADALQQQQFTSLVHQDGVTADDIREAHRKSEQHHRQIAAINDTITSAYRSSHDSGSELQRELGSIAHDGNFRIEQIQRSKDPLAIKIGKITDVVMDCQTQANIKAATYCDNVFNEVQKVLDERGIPLSARQFAKDNGVDLTGKFGSPNKESVREQVEALLNKSNAAASTQPLSNHVSPADTPGLRPEDSASNIASTPPQSTPVVAPTLSPANPPTNIAPTRAQTPLSNGPAVQPPLASSNIAPTPPATPSASTPPAPARISSPASSIPGTSAVPPVSAPNMPSMPSAPAMPSTAARPPVTPASLLHSFDQGMQMGAPMSAAANAVPPMGPVEPQMPEPAAPTPNVAATSPASAHVPIIDTPHAPAADVAPLPPPTHAPTSDAGTSYVAGPAPTATPSAAAAPAGPLPAYGADIRPPASAAAAPPTAPAGPAPATAASAPVSSSSSAGGISQPAVMRRPDTVPTPSPTPAGVGEQAALAAAGGTTAGAASAATTAKARLQRLVDFVARQEPRLNWAAGDRPDGTTVLVTDLASGWIPPEIDIPVGMQLRDPAKRRGDLESLLGEVTVTASYTRLHQVPPACSEHSG
ncbi:putative transmembrane protein [Mycobacterium xenopi]|nr:putative transmembrane protein [Mycobacterium xenopi]